MLIFLFVFFWSVANLRDRSGFMCVLRYEVNRGPI